MAGITFRRAAMTSSFPKAWTVPMLAVLATNMAAAAEPQQHLEALRQQGADAQIRAGGQSGVARLKQNKQDALSFPLMDEMAASARRKQAAAAPQPGKSAVVRGKAQELTRTDAQAAAEKSDARFARALKAYQASAQATPSHELAQMTLEKHASGEARLFGWNALKAGNTESAIYWFGQAHGWSPTDADARHGLAFAQYKAGNAAAALNLLQDAEDAPSRALRGDIFFSQGMAEYEASHFQNAAKLWQQAELSGRDGRDVQLMQAWTRLRLGDDAAAMQRFAGLYQAHPDAEAAQGLYQAANASGRQEQLPLWMSGNPDDPLRRLVQSRHGEFLKQQGWVWAAHAHSPNSFSELAGIQGPWVDVGAAMRSKSGDSGQSRLQIDLQPVLEAQLGNGNDIWQLRLSRMSLNSGDLPAGTFFGSYNAAASYVAQPTTQSSGWVPTLRWRHEGDGSASQLSLGTTPTGAPAGVTPTFEAMMEHIDEQSTWHAAAYRSSVRDSVLSIVGAVDPYSAEVWGRVVRNGLRADTYRAVSGPWGVSGNIRAEQIEGVNVAANARVAGGLGVGYELGGKDFTYFSVGPGIDYEHYKDNLSHFTWGHGGYFSPQSFINVGLNVRFLTREGGNFVARGQVSAGWQRISEDAAACFSLAPATAQPDCGTYAGNSKQGMGGSVEGSWRYAVNPHWQVGGALSLRSSQNYSDASVLLTLRYSWSVRHGLYRADLPDSMFSDLF